MRRSTSRVLGITLTKRGNGAAGEIPLAGFPHHALDAYLPKLLKAGYRVAVCEQMEDPRFAKGIVKREVIEVVTPGVAFSDRVLEQKQNNYLAAIALSSPLATGTDTVGFAFVDVSTAEFRAGEFPLRRLPEQVASVAPAEILVQKRDLNALKEILAGTFNGLYTPVEDWVVTFDYAYELLTRQLQTKSLKGFGLEDTLSAATAAGVVMNYLQETQQQNLLHIRSITPVRRGGSYCRSMPSTKRNLEITSSLGGIAGGDALLRARPDTHADGRPAAQAVDQQSPEPGRPRSVGGTQAVAELVGIPDLLDAVCAVLQRIGDIERLTTRICTGRAGPRDMVGLRHILDAVAAAPQWARTGAPHRSCASSVKAFSPSLTVAALLD